MAEGDITVYNDFKEKLMLAVHDMDTHAFKVILVASHTPDIDSHDQYADVSADEYGSGDGYTAGGEALGSLSVTQDNTNDRALWDAGDVTWSSLGALSPATPSHAIIYNDTPAGDPLVAYMEIGSTATNGGNYTIQWSASPAAILSLS